MSYLSIYTQTTHEVRVTVYPTYLESHSSPEQNHFLWVYHVRIENNGEKRLQLRERYWRITDSLGRIHEVRGGGVVGEQPVLAPGDIFEYTSGTPLVTPSGIMVGTYKMESEEGEVFEISVPAFSLDSPYQNITLN